VEPEREPAHADTVTSDGPVTRDEYAAATGGLTPDMLAEIEDVLRRSGDGLSHGATFRLREEGLDDAEISDRRGVGVGATRVFLQSLDMLLTGTLPKTESAALTNSYVYRELLNHARSDNLDIDGIGVEVKSAAYVQSWEQTGPSVISFDIGPKTGWGAGTNTYAASPGRSADVPAQRTIRLRPLIALGPHQCTYDERWRRDLNPRSVLADSRFQGECIRPLCHATAGQSKPARSQDPRLRRE
jgi:hypothetical protein